jgi:hypothetical protein
VFAQAGAVIALAAYFVAWVGGIVSGVGQALNNQALTVAGIATTLLLEPAVIVAGLRSAGAASAGNPFSGSGRSDAHRTNRPLAQ